MISTLLLALTTAQAQDNNENILLIIADDIGIGEIAEYGDPNDSSSVAYQAPPTPAIERLADSGVTFDHAWSNPVCSPTRAGIYTGKRAQDHGVVDLLESNEVGLDGTQLTLGDVVDAGKVGLFGKWHVGDVGAGGQPRHDMPLVNGFDTHRGSLHGKPQSNWGGSSICNYEDSGYLCWDKFVDGSPIGSPIGAETTYATFDTTDEAMNFISVESAYLETWVAVVAYNSSHSPFHSPPPSCASGPVLAGQRYNYQQMTRCLDHEIDRLIDHLEAIGELENTTVIFVGDNGTPREVGNSYYGDPSVQNNHHWKGSIYQGGIHVPLIIADGYHLRWNTAEGASESGEFSLPSAVIGTHESQGLVHTRDLFNTIREISGLTPIIGGTVDSKSMVPYLDGSATGSLRQTVFTARVQNGQPTCAVRDERFKLIRKSGGSEEMYDLGLLNDEKELLPLSQHTTMSVYPQLAGVLDDMGC